jgi:hypothetical protein
VGGIPEMIDHKENGYVARYKDAQDLAEGIRYVIAKENHARLSRAARNKVIRCYSEEAVANKYLTEINRAIGGVVPEKYREAKGFMPDTDRGKGGLGETGNKEKSGRKEC